MAKYETAVLKELIGEAVIGNQELLATEYPSIVRNNLAKFFSDEKFWKRTHKGNIQPFGRSDSTQAVFRYGAIERAFAFKSYGVELQAFVYTNLTDEKVIAFKFMVLPSRKIIEVSV